MKKNIEWLKSEILELSIKARRKENNQREWHMGHEMALFDVNKLIDQLDEPETLSEEWIENHTASADTISYYSDESVPVVTVIKLKNLLVPKQDEPEKTVIPQFVADWFEVEMAGYIDKYVILERFMCDYNAVELPNDLYNYYDNNKDNSRDKVINAILYGYEVEKEQKYILSINITHKESNTNYETFLNKRGIFHSMENESFNSEKFNWTEEEIKELESGEILFEHFATKVEELEE